jgi:hypothetical protein
MCLYVLSSGKARQTTPHTASRPPSESGTGSTLTSHNFITGMSKVVFGMSSAEIAVNAMLIDSSVGNVPYNMGEEQLIDAFKSVGQVVGFRYVPQDAYASCCARLRSFSFHSVDWFSTGKQGNQRDTGFASLPVA